MATPFPKQAPVLPIFEALHVRAAGSIRETGLDPATRAFMNATRTEFLLQRVFMPRRALGQG
jgi:hypothetical protein